MMVGDLYKPETYAFESPWVRPYTANSRKLTVEYLQSAEASEVYHTYAKENSTNEEF